jgi:hypothetical protein
METHTHTTHTHTHRERQRIQRSRNKEKKGPPLSLVPSRHMQGWTWIDDIYLDSSIVLQLQVRQTDRQTDGLIHIAAGLCATRLVSFTISISRSQISSSLLLLALLFFFFFFERIKTRRKQK